MRRVNVPLENIETGLTLLLENLDDPELMGRCGPKLLIQALQRDVKILFCMDSKIHCPGNTTCAKCTER